MHFTIKALVALVALPAALGHSWIEQVRAVNSDGQYVGEYGYPRGFVSKNAPGYDGEKDMVYLLPPLETQPPFINSSHLLCHPNQREQTQNDQFPRVKGTAGGYLALRYAENGHVSNPSPLNGHTPGTVEFQRRENGGSIFVYGTTDPKPDETIANVLQWTTDGRGGDRGGVLLTVNDFDDGRCYEINPVTEHGERMKAFPNYAQGQAPQGSANARPGDFPLMCETNVELPKDAPNGKPYTLYWVWQWPFDPNPKSQFFPNGKDEYYTTCLDVDIVETVKEESKLQFALAPQDAMENAVRDFKNRKALIMNAMEGEVGPVFSGKPTPTAGVPPASQGTLVPSAPPYANSSTGLQAPTITRRPGGGGRPTKAPSSKLTTGPGEGGMVTIIVTERITVTAPAVTQIATARAEHVARHKNGAKFRRGTFFAA